MSSLILTVLACAPPDYSGPEPAVPSITLLFPSPEFYSSGEVGRDVCPDFQVVVAVENFQLVEANSVDVEGEGHWHLHLDDPDLVSYLQVGSGEVVDLDEPLTLGNHTLYAALRQNTHAPLPSDMVVDGSDVSLAEITVADSEDCIGNKNSGS
ncbi:MAG: hypothetical protein ACI9VR_004718 [Cognaticolwellia sp.]|jgi:hypothetical protein